MVNHDLSFKSLPRFFVFILKPFRGFIALMLWIALVWAFCTSLMPYALKGMIDRASLDVNELANQPIWVPVLLYLGLAVFSSLNFRLYDYFISTKMIPKMRTHIVMTAYKRLLKQSHTFYQNNFAGSLMSRVSELSGSVPEALEIIVNRIVFTVLALSIATLTLWHVNYRFAVAFVLWIFLYAVFLTWRIKYVRYYASSWSNCGAKLNGNLVDVFGNMMAVRFFNLQPLELKKHYKAAQEAIFLEEKLQINYLFIWLFYGCTYLLLQASVLYFLVEGRRAGFVSVGDFALVISICTAISEHMWQLARDLPAFAKFTGRIEQTLKVLQQPIDIVDAPNAGLLQVRQGEIAFDQVHFHYKENNALFDNKSIVIEAGSKVGLVGYSGSGKTTFVNLIARLYDVQSGKICIDGQNIAEVTQSSLHAAIGMIPQEPNLFHRSLYDNIACARENASHDEVLAASIKAKAHDFIMQLPQGYDSLVGERGIKLSGGQRQRIAIARAILKNAPILIVDEATSQLDSLIESEIQENLWELMQGKTTVVIAHRLSTLLRMDRILVFDKGTIVQEGSHTQLLAQGGLYQQLWEAQVGGFLPMVR